MRISGSVGCTDRRLPCVTVNTVAELPWLELPPPSVHEYRTRAEPAWGEDDPLR